VARTIFAFNRDLESRLALHWLVHERGFEVLSLSLNLGQEVYLEPLGETGPGAGRDGGPGDRLPRPVPARFRLACAPGGCGVPAKLLSRFRAGSLTDRAGAGPRGSRGRLRAGGPQRRQQRKRPGADGDGHRRPRSSARGTRPEPAVELAA
jgi:hypothetical protein